MVHRVHVHSPFPELEGVFCGMQNFKKVYFAEFLLHKKHAKLGVICKIKIVEIAVVLCQSVE